MKAPSIRTSYRPLVKLGNVHDFREKQSRSMMGDRRDGRFYRYTKEIKLAVNVALAVGRPVLLTGVSGGGKSTLAFNLARIMKRRYYEFVVTSRSQARDLFYRFDAVRRLGEAQWRQPSKEDVISADERDESWQSKYPYLEPGPLWWMLDREGARRRGYSGVGKLPFAEALDPARPHDDQDKPPGSKKPPKELSGSVLLIDEIDKADPDFPNNLLVPLGSWEFTVEELGIPINLPRKEGVHPLDHPLVIVTSNRQRELPDTFLRRCIVLDMTPPDAAELVKIALAAFGPKRKKFYEKIAKLVSDHHNGTNLSVAEYLDAVQAIDKLHASNDALAQIVGTASWRSPQP